MAHFKKYIFYRPIPTRHLFMEKSINIFFVDEKLSEVLLL